MGMYDRDWARAKPAKEYAGDGLPRWLIYVVIAVLVLATASYFFGDRWGPGPSVPSPYDDALYMAIVSRNASEAGRIARKEPERLSKPIGNEGEEDIPLLVAITAGGREVVAALLENGADPNAKGTGGRTALHCAAAAGDETLARLLVEHGANVSAADDVGFTPLFDAAECGAAGNVTVAKMLVDAGAEWSAATADGQTPLKIAEQEHNLSMVSFLKQLSSRVPEEAMATILAQKAHRLTFREYVGHGDPDTAVYVVDGIDIGKGAEGWEALKYVVTRLPAGSRLVIGPYYGGGGYPFRDSDLSDHAAKYGVSVGVPGL